MATPSATPRYGTRSAVAQASYVDRQATASRRGHLACHSRCTWGNPRISHWPLDSSGAAPQQIARASTTASRILKVQAHLMDCRIARKIAASSGCIFQSSQSSRSAALGRSKAPPELDPELRAEWPRPDKRYPVRWRKSWPASCFIGAIATSLLLMACGHLQAPSPNDRGLAAKAPSNGSSLENPSVRIDRCRNGSRRKSLSDGISGSILRVLAQARSVAGGTPPCFQIAGMRTSATENAPCAAETELRRSDVAWRDAGGKTDGPLAARRIDHDEHRRMSRRRLRTILSKFAGLHCALHSEMCFILSGSVRRRLACRVPVFISFCL
jgi:hypothetical protein